MKEFLPVVLGHESEEGQKGPAEGIKTGVAIVWIPSDFQTIKPIWTLPVMHKQQRTDDNGTVAANKGCAQQSQRQLGEIKLW